MKSIEQKQAENINDVLENGPRLTYTRNTWILAKSQDGAFVYCGGLGVFGVGRMWCVATESDQASPEYAKAPTYHYVPSNKIDGSVFRLGEKISD